MRGAHTAFRSVLPLLVLMTPTFLTAQSSMPSISHGFVVSGYGTAGWFDTEGEPNGFFATINPILIFRMTDKVFGEAELEFEFDEGATQTGLEYATMHYLANDYLTLSVGKFLLPFGVFGQRLHPSWINRFNSMPPMYGHHGGIPGLDPLLPILSDVGVMASVVAPVGGVGQSLTFTGYVTNGPQAEAGGHDHEAEMAEEHGSRPEFGFGEFAGDNNDSKMLGGRMGLVLAPNFEIDASVLHAQWGKAEVGVNAGTSLSFDGYNLAAEFRPHPQVELRSEWMWLRTDVEEAEATVSTIETVSQVGGYVQAAVRQGPWEPLFRFGLVDQNQNTPDSGFKQYGFGVNYWFSPSVVIMAAWEVNRDHLDHGSDLANDRLLIHWAFGF